MDPGTKQLDEETLFGGVPARVLRLSAPAWHIPARRPWLPGRT